MSENNTALFDQQDFLNTQTFPVKESYVLFSRFIFVVVVVLLQGCATTSRLAVPENLTNDAQIVDLPEIRFWGDDVPQNIEQIVRVKVDQSLQARPQVWNRNRTIDINFLIITGGGPDGAFGAGLLNGMTKSEARIEYEVVTGVSTGALIAPFAFLGSEYDAQLTEFYTNSSSKDIVRPTVLAGLLGGRSLGDTKPLANLIAKHITPDFLTKVAREHRKGRRLFVGTTNIDAQRSVIWNMGKIAGYGGPKGLALFRRVLLASAAIPAVFPPVRIEVEAGGKVSQELHVDGGAISNAFFLPLRVGLGSYLDKRGLKVRRTMYIIRNSRSDPEWEKVEERTLSIASRSIATLLKSSTTGDLFKLFAFAKRNDIAFRMANVPATFNVKPKETFDQNYMRALYQVGFELGKKGYKWAKVPPGF